MAKNIEKDAETSAPATSERTETAREALHRRVKQNQERRRQKQKHINP